MKIEEFKLERLLSVWQNVVDYNFTDTGVHSLYLNELVTREELEELYESVQLRYIQTNGPIPLRESICQLYPGAGVDNVLVTNGSSEANFATLWKLIEPGDEVVVMLPNYLQVPGMAANLGATVKPFHLREDKDWAPDLDELNDCVTPKTKLIYICNPNNPTGAIMDAADAKEIVKVAERVGAWLLSDEVYRGAELSGEMSSGYWGLYDKTLVVSGLSKAFALPGLRIGWVVGPKETIGEIWGYTDYTTITTGAINAALARQALRPGTRERIRRRNQKTATKNLEILTDWLAGYPELLRFVHPTIGGVAFIGYNLKIGSMDLVMKLVHERSVLIAPGEACGLEGYVRIGYGSPKLAAGLELIGKTLKELEAAH